MHMVRHQWLFQESFQSPAISLKTNDNPAQDFCKIPLLASKLYLTQNKINWDGTAANAERNIEAEVAGDQPENGMDFFDRMARTTKYLMKFFNTSVGNKNSKSPKMN